MRERHGRSKTRTYRIWQGMHERCSNSKRPEYVRYGGRGIGVCARWENFSAFFEDMGEAPPGFSLDRVDNHGHYEPGNCRWISHRENSAKTSRNILLTHAGKTLTLQGWASELKIPRHVLVYRHHAGWSVERMLTTKPKKCQKTISPKNHLTRAIEYARSRVRHRERYQGLAFHAPWVTRPESLAEEIGWPTSGQTLDRIDNAVGYVPGNVRWATWKEQARNRRNNGWFDVRGQRLTATDCAKIAQVSVTTFLRRISTYGYTPEEATYGKG